MENKNKISVSNSPAEYNSSLKLSSHKKIGWFRICCISIGGSATSLILLGTLIPQTSLYVIGSIAIPLFTLGMVMSLLAIPSWLELTLTDTTRTGGVTATAAQVIRPYGELLANLAGTCYWLGRIPLCSMAASICAFFIHQWFFPNISLEILSTGVILIATLIVLRGIGFVALIATPIAVISIIVMLLAGALPIFSGNVNWSQIITIHFTTNNTYNQLIGYTAALFLIGMGTSTFEQVTCFTNEMKNPEKNVKKAIYLSALITSLFFVFIPAIWLGTFGVNLAFFNIADILSTTLFPIFGSYVKMVAGGILILLLFHTVLTILMCVPRTFMQLAQDGLVPHFFSTFNKNNAPVKATLFTAIIAIIFVYLGNPLWAFVGGCFAYLVGMTCSLVAVILLRRKINANAPPEKVFRPICLLVASFWGTVIFLGFERFGFMAVLTGILFGYAGAMLYSWRRMWDRAILGLSAFNTLPVKLTIFSILIILLNATAFNIAVNQVLPQKATFVNLYTEIFLVVSILIFCVALIIPNILSNSALQVAKSAKELSKGTLSDFTKAMIALGKGDLNAAQASISMTEIPVYSRDDEVSEMAISFNELQHNIMEAATGLEGARVGLMEARNKLIDTNVTLSIKERALREINETLEERVKERTEQLEKTQQQLLTTAHLAGMAEVATNVLHNVGNILNTINVSAGLISEKIAHSELHSALKNINMIFNQHKDDLGNFITKDPKGVLIPDYIDEVYIQWKKEYSEISTELGSLTRNIDHIRDIIITQQMLSGISGFEQIINIEEVIEEALKITELDKRQNVVNIKKEYTPLEPILVDKIKLLQILINLIRNAKDALMESPRKDKELILKTCKVESDKFIIEIVDNGIGINPDNMKFIFTHGFTTKVKGHGFGLHSCALAAKEMNGELRFETKGPGSGATFILELPYKVSVDATTLESADE